MKTVVIFGGSGFVGSHITRRIARKGYKIIIPYRRSANEPKLRLFGNVGQVIPIKYKNIEERSISNMVKEAEVIINLRTLWDEKKITFNQGIYQFNVDLIRLINSIDRNKLFIFFSGIGIEKNSKSPRSATIFQTENFIMNHCFNYSIIKPGIIIGGGDQFLMKILPIFKISPIIPLFGKGLSKVQPVYIDDLVKAIEQIINNISKKNDIFELVGQEIFTYKTLYSHIASCLKSKPFFVSIPFSVMKFFIFISKFTPFDFLNSEQLELFKSDNISTNFHKNFENLGIIPQDLRQIINNSIKKM